MIGKGKLIVSKDTVIAALQDYLDKRWTVDPPVITDILANHSGPGAVRYELELSSNREFIGIVQTVEV